MAFYADFVRNLADGNPKAAAEAIGDATRISPSEMTQRQSGSNSAVKMAAGGSPASESASNGEADGSARCAGSA